MTSDETKLPAAVILGGFLLEHYASEMAHVDVPQFLADVIDLCQRFGIDFHAALEVAEDRNRPGGIPGSGLRLWTVTLSYEVDFGGSLEVFADTYDEAVKTARENFVPRWSNAEPPEVCVVSWEDHGPKEEARLKQRLTGFAQALSDAGKP
jgi:hypothetical protein